jgi:hypothetical protein
MIVFDGKRLGVCRSGESPQTLLKLRPAITGLYFSPFLSNIQRVVSATPLETLDKLIELYGSNRNAAINLIMEGSEQIL